MFVCIHSRQFFDGIFVVGLEEILKGATLWMLVCGHMVRETESFKGFTASVKRCVIWSFPILDLLLTLF